MPKMKMEAAREILEIEVRLKLGLTGPVAPDAANAPSAQTSGMARSADAV
jgi:hypothetical protein